MAYSVASTLCQDVSRLQQGGPGSRQAHDKNMSVDTYDRPENRTAPALLSFFLRVSTDKHAIS
jgi:hypothetical protein